MALFCDIFLMRKFDLFHISANVNWMSVKVAHIVGLRRANFCQHPVGQANL